MSVQLKLFESADPLENQPQPPTPARREEKEEKQPNLQTLQKIKKVQERIDNGEITLKEDTTKHGMRVINLSVGEEEIGSIGNGLEQNYWEIGKTPLEIREDYRNQGLGTFLLYLSLKQALDPTVNPQKKMIIITISNPRIKHMLDNLGIEYQSKTITDPSEAPYEPKTESQREIAEIPYPKLKKYLEELEELERMLRSQDIEVDKN